MKRARLLRTTAKAILLLVFLFIMIPQGVHAQIQVTEYPFGQSYQSLPDYIFNMKLVLQNIGGGKNEWVIPAKSTVSYNGLAGAMNASEGYLTVYGTPGAGACDIATMFYHVANASGVITANATKLDHPKIYGVPLPAVTIWNPGRDLSITNENSYDVVIHWDYESHPGYIKFWVDTSANGSVAPAIALAQPSTQPIVKIPFNPVDLVNGIRWDILGYIVMGFLVILFLFHDKVILGINHAYRDRDRIMSIQKQAFKESLEYWAVITVGSVLMIPDLQNGFDTWLYGYTTVKNSNILLFLSALLGTLLLKRVRHARLEQERREGREPRKPMLAAVLILSVVVAGIFAGFGSYNVVQANTYSGECAVSSKFPQGVTQWCALITRESRKNGLDPNLVASLILQESTGDPKAYSEDGAVGLMQVMPRDGIAGVKYSVFKNRPSMAELYDPEFNIVYGTRMLAALIRANGQRDGLKSYGPAGVGYYYADIVLGLYNQYK